MSLPSKNHIYFFANWKMYLDTEQSIALAQVYQTTIATHHERIRTVVFPSSLAFSSVSGFLQSTSVALGAQHAYWVERGGYTGEVSMDMYKKAGAAYVLIGHSERRHIFHESNHDVRQQIERALEVGLVPVVCVGETAEEREKGETDKIIEIQVRAAFEDIKWNKEQLCVIAYEPVWAVGTGNACDPLEAERMHQLVKTIVSGLTPQMEPIMLYGGSVRAENVRSFLEQKHIDGVLVGQASTQESSILNLIEHIS